MKLTTYIINIERLLEMSHHLQSGLTNRILAFSFWWSVKYLAPVITVQVTYH